MLADDFNLHFPLKCTVGENCWIQQYPDHGQGGEPVDYRCGHETYAGHDGTDIRVINTHADVTVVAAAPGIVKAIRNSVHDQLALTQEDLALVAGSECGNGVLIAHEGGYETQYCHMRLGSVVVKPGDHVDAGTALGLVGYSGKAAFAHLHLSVRHNGEKLDPFSGLMTSSCERQRSSVWAHDASFDVSYHDAELIEFGWAKKAVDLVEIEDGLADSGPPSKLWPAIVAYARFIHLLAGDQLHMVFSGPGGFVAENTIAIVREKAEEAIFVGSRPSDKWQPGEYSAKLQLLRDGKIRLEKTEAFLLLP